MAKKSISGPEKAAVVFLHMNEDAAAEAFKSLSRREIKLLSNAAKDVANLEKQKVDEVLAEFIAALKNGNSELKGGSEFVTMMAAKNLGMQKAKEFLDDESGLSDTLSDVDSQTIANLIKKEHPQTTALILAHLPPERGAQVLQLLSEGVQSDVLRRLATLDTVSPDVVELVEEALISEIQMMGKGLSRKVGGVNLVAEIMNQLEKSREQALMKDLEEVDENLAEEVRNLMFVFDDLIFVNGRGIQRLLQDVERETLVLSLKAVDEDLKQHFFSNLSARAVEMIVEDIDNRGPVRLSEVEKAQTEIVKSALMLIDSGEIEVSKGSEDAFV
ncbi:MAG: flagellar motor switch protein FliG [Myxococcales bacterium]|nr:flagellar motor switch protein FliG [Myxococcales bacterium]